MKMKRILTLIICLCMVMSLVACGGSNIPNDDSTEQQDPKQLFAELQDNIKNESAYVTKSSVYKDSENGDIFLIADIINNSGKTISNIDVAFTAYDIDGVPVVIKSASGNTEDSYTKEVNLSGVTILPGQEWLGDSEDEVFGFRVSSEQMNIAYAEAIVISYSTEDGGEWSNPHYYEWRRTFGGEKLEDWMRTGNSTVPENTEYETLNSEDETIAQTREILLGDTGAKFYLPSEIDFAQQESQLNEYWGLGSGGYWAIIVNTDKIENYGTIEEFVDSIEQDTTEKTVAKDENGNYYIIYVDANSNRHYTTIRSGTEKYYRISFYCPEGNWSDYGEQFPKWAASIAVE